MIIALNHGYCMEVDEEDYSALSQYTWHVLIGKGGPYATRTSHRKHVLAHRQILAAPRWAKIDHIDGNGLNNKRSNLRFATSSQNQANAKRKRNSKYRYKGLGAVKLANGRMKFMANIKVCGERKYLGCYETQEGAAAAYDKAARELYGEFARCNFHKEGL